MNDVALWDVIALASQTLIGKGVFARKETQGRQAATVIHATREAAGSFMVVFEEDKTKRVLASVQVDRYVKSASLVSLEKLSGDDRAEVNAFLSACRFLAKDKRRNKKQEKLSFEATVHREEKPSKYHWAVFFVRLPAMPGGHFTIREDARGKVLDLLPGM